MAAVQRQRPGQREALGPWSTAHGDVCTRNKEIEYLLHVVGRVGGVGVDVVRHGADLPLLHDLRIAHTNKVSNDLVSLFKLFAELKRISGCSKEKKKGPRVFFSALQTERLSHAARPGLDKAVDRRTRKK